MSLKDQYVWGADQISYAQVTLLVDAWEEQCLNRHPCETAIAEALAEFLNMSELPFEEFYESQSSKKICY